LFNFDATILAMSSKLCFAALHVCCETQQAKAQVSILTGSFCLQVCSGIHTILPYDARDGILLP